MVNEKETKIIKTRGKVYTPPNIVAHILDLSDYFGKSILKKHVIDNSCGDGAFLVEVVKRYIDEALANNFSNKDIKSDLETYIHGIEINSEEREKCLKNVSAISEKYNLKNIKWDIICENSLNVDKYDGKMDYVVGNPPYVRVHNLGDSLKNIKTFKFSTKGMTDLFIVFFEIGLKMLNKNGILGYITPSSLFNSLACNNIRKHFLNNKLLTKIVDFKHNQVFDVTTYSTISILSNTNKKEEVEYYEYDANNDALIFVDNLKYKDFYINKNFYFTNKDNLNYLEKLLNNKTKNNLVEVKNGFATLSDKFFIGKFDFKDYIIPIIKASTGEHKECLFPYKKGSLVSYEDLTKNKKLKKYFEDNKTNLKQRSLEKEANWYGFGRSQGIKDVCKNKLTINSIIKDLSSIKLNRCPKGTGVYSGLYILTDIEEEKIKKIINDEKFINYIKMLGKYKSGGYYTYSSKDLKKYLEYELSTEA